MLNKMRGLIIFSVILHLGLCYASPAATHGIGAYAYQDSSGNRYGGTYDIGPDALGPENNYIGPVGNDFQDVDSFYPVYFRNFENFLKDERSIGFHENFHRRTSSRLRNLRGHRRAFGSNIANQRLASLAAQRAFDVSSYRIRHISPFFRFSTFGGFPNTPIQPIMPNFGPFGPNSAISSAVAGPGLIHQLAAINPASNKDANVNVLRSGMPRSGNNFYGVSSSSHVSSSNVNGKQESSRRAETVVNENGKITSYRVES